MVPIYHNAHQAHDVAFAVLLCPAIIPSEASLIDLRRDPLRLEEKRACVRHHLGVVSILQKRISKKTCRGPPVSARIGLCRKVETDIGIEITECYVQSRGVDRFKFADGRKIR